MLLDHVDFQDHKEVKENVVNLVVEDHQDLKVLKENMELKDLEDFMVIFTFNIPLLKH